MPTRKCRPPWSSGLFVLVQDTTVPSSPADPRSCTLITAALVSRHGLAKPSWCRSPTSGTSRCCLDLRQWAGDRPVYGYLEVPDACYDLSTAGWEVIYPHVSYFDAYSLVRMVQRAGWRVEDTGTLFGGMCRCIEISAHVDEPRRGEQPVPGTAERDRQLAAVTGFAERHLAERAAWQERITELARQGGRPVLWGAGSRGVQFLTFADPDRQGNTNPSYREEICAQLRSLGVKRRTTHRLNQGWHAAFAQLSRCPVAAHKGGNADTPRVGGGTDALVHVDRKAQRAADHGYVSVRHGQIHTGTLSDQSR